MFCSRCGAANPDGPEVRFCHVCGAELAAAGAGSEAMPPLEPTAASTQPLYPASGGYGPAVTGVPVQAAVFPYGGFWIRLVAWLIDAILLGVLGAIFGFVFGLMGALGGVRESAVLSTTNLVSFIFGLAYYVALPPLAGATVGKLILGYKIVGPDGRQIGAGRALGRYLGYIVSAIVFGLGFIWIGVDAYKQGWHDKIAGTYV
ncbi:MAG: RDD family protein, partial [Chloroflexi bacterium]|nr:RDD family protein [Chloroflexota bacterium]